MSVVIAVNFLEFLLQLCAIALFQLTTTEITKVVLKSVLNVD